MSRGVEGDVAAEEEFGGGNSKEGWMLKRRKLRGGWRKVYVVVSGEEMKYGETRDVRRWTDR